MSLIEELRVEARQEARLRRLARRHVLRVEKSRCRTPESPAYGGFMLIPYGYGGNQVVAGADPFAYCLSLEDLAEAIEERVGD